MFKMEDMKNTHKPEPKAIHETWGLTSNYDRMLFIIINTIHQAYWEENLEVLEKAIKSLITMLPPDQKLQAWRIYNEYEKEKSKIIPNMKRGMLLKYYRYKQLLVENLMMKYDKIMDLMHKAHIIIYGKAQGLPLIVEQKQ